MTKRTKIVATVGPSTSDNKIIKSMIKEGVNVFRINFSHGSHEDHIKAVNRIKKVDAELGTHSAILADLQGPKIRIGEMPEKGVLLEKNQDFYLTTEKKYNKKNYAYISLKQLPKDVKKGEKIPASKLNKAAKAKGKLGQRARFAKTLSRLRKK